MARDHLFIYISDGHDCVEVACHGWVVVKDAAQCPIVAGTTSLSPTRNFSSSNVKSKITMFWVRVHSYL